MMTEALVTGISAIDLHHQDIISELNKFYAEMMEGAGESAVAAMIAKIDQSIAQHFKEEEGVMSRNNYPHLEAHRRNHQEFLDKYASLRQAAQNRQPNATTELFKYTSSWLSGHIRQEDLKMATYIREHNAT